MKDLLYFRCVFTCLFSKTVSKLLDNIKIRSLFAELLYSSCRARLFLAERDYFFSELQKESDLSKLNTVIKECEEDINELERMRDKLENDLTLAKKEIANNQKTIEKQSKKIFGKDKAAGKITQLKSEIQSIQGNEQRISVEIEGVKKEINDATNRLSNLRVEHKTLETEIQTILKKYGLLSVPTHVA